MQKKINFTSSLALYIYMFHQKVALEITIYNRPLWVFPDNKAQNVFQTYTTTTNEKRSEWTP